MSSQLGGMSVKLSLELQTQLTLTSSAPAWSTQQAAASQAHNTTHATHTLTHTHTHTDPHTLCHLPSVSLLLSFTHMYVQEKMPKKCHRPSCTHFTASS